MTTEQIIQRYQKRSGFRLADYAEVALPTYALNIQALTMAHRRLPPIEEFVLRCLAMNLSSAEELSRFLGLEQQVVKAALVSLAQTESIALTAPHGKQSWALTQKGRSTLETAELIVPEARTFPIHFDAITRKPTLYRFQTLLKHNQLADEGLMEIEQIPPKRPQANEITPLDIELILKTIRSSAEERRDVLAIRSMENIKRVYIRAIALLFRRFDGDDVQVAFVIDGKLSADHELAFARSEGLRRLAISLTPDADEQQELVAAAGSAVHDSSLRSADLALHSATTAAEVALAETAQALEVTQGTVEREALREKLRSAEAELARLREEAKRIQVRNIYVLDHPPLLDDALINTKERLMIISPWIRAEVVTHEFIRKLERLLRNGVNVYIGYGISKQVTQKPDAEDVSVIQELRTLREKYANFCFVRLGNTHAKILIKDREFAATTSFNWLSFRGDPTLTFRDEQGTLVQTPELVEQKFAELIKRFEAPAIA